MRDFYYFKHFMRKISLFFSLLFLFLGFSLTAQAITYTPGATLDPACLPTDPTCIVQVPAASGANTDITSIISPLALSLKSTTNSAVTLDSGSTGTINIGTGSDAKAIVVGNSTGSTGIYIWSGSGKIWQTWRLYRCW